MHESDWITDEPLCEPCRAELEKTGSELRTCTDCSKPWVFEAGEKQFLEKCAAEAAEDGRNFTMPMRCKPCRERKKRAREEEESAQREEENSDDSSCSDPQDRQDLFDIEHFEEESALSSDDDGLTVSDLQQRGVTERAFSLRTINQKLQTRLDSHNTSLPCARKPISVKSSRVSCQRLLVSCTVVSGATPPQSCRAPGATQATWRFPGQYRPLRSTAAR